MHEKCLDRKKGFFGVVPSSLRLVPPLVTGLNLVRQTASLKFYNFMHREMNDLHFILRIKNEPEGFVLRYKTLGSNYVHEGSA